MTRSLFSLTAAGLLSCLSAFASANSPYSSLIVFGDSLNDAGWNSDASGPKRYTNRVGPTYLPGEAYSAVSPMVLGAQLGLPSASLESAQIGGDNWAVGGDRTDQIYTTITQSYLATQGGRADPHALYLLSGGGNDFLQLRVTDIASAQLSAGQLVDGVRALDQAGARQIMVWMLPDVSKTPAISGTALAPLVSELGLAFNQELVSQLSTLNANVIALNIPLMLEQVLSDPGRYGLAADIPASDLITSCFDDCGNPNSVYGIGGTNPDPTKLLFNDGVHPTIAGQRLIADYAYSLLAAPWQVSLLAQMAQGTQRAQQDMLRGLWQSEQYSWQQPQQWRTFVNASGHRQRYDQYSVDAAGNGFSVALGASYRLTEHWRAGVALSLAEQHLKEDHSGTDYELTSYLANVFAQYQQDRIWADVSLQAGALDFGNLKRKFTIGVAEQVERGNSDGHLWAISGRAGYDLLDASSTWQVSPFVSADYSRVVVDAYNEKSSSASALNYSKQTRDSKRAGLGVQALADVTEHTRWFGEVAWEHEFKDDVARVEMSLRSLPGIRYELDGFQPENHAWRASVGLKHSFSPAVVMQAGYNYWHSKAQDQHGVNLSFKWDL